MENGSFDIHAYLERINYEGTTDVSYDTLRALHIAHTTNVPFENFDVYLQRPIKLDPDSLFQKIVVDRRGGYCFEMNGIFSIVLKKLGFKVTDLLARGTRDGINYMSRTHQVLMVEIGKQRYLADVGYGNDGIMEPLLLVEKLEQPQVAYTYRLMKDEKLGYILQKKVEEEFQPMYAFTLEECCYDDYLMSNHYTATHPESFFRMVRLCTMPTEKGRVTLFGNDLKILANGQTTQKAIESEAEFKQIVKEYFDLNLDQISKE